MGIKSSYRFMKLFDPGWKFLAIFPALFYVAGIGSLLYSSNLGELGRGLERIVNFAPGQVNDFLAIGGLEASMINAALIGSLNVWLVFKSRCPLEGKMIAAFFTVMGFSFIGKTIFNILPIYLGGWIYWRKHRGFLRDVLPVIMFATSLAPIISWLANQPELGGVVRSMTGAGVGIALGYAVVPVANRLHFFHRGHNLYHIGFCTGLLATGVAGIGRIFNLDISSTRSVSLATPWQLHVLFGVIVVILAGMGFALGRCHEHPAVKQFSGSPCKDRFDWADMLLNMATLALVSLVYVGLVGGMLSGPVIAAIFTMIGFGACGKTPANCLPVMAGAIGGILFLGLPLNDPGLIGAVLFATTLAPVVTSYGRLAGLAAGFCHLFLVGDTILLHGGLCLYNNGFTGGLVAGTLVSLFEGLRYNKSGC